MLKAGATFIKSRRPIMMRIAITAALSTQYAGELAA